MVSIIAVLVLGSAGHQGSHNAVDALKFLETKGYRFTNSKYGDPLISKGNVTVLLNDVSSSDRVVEIDVSRHYSFKREIHAAELEDNETDKVVKRTFETVIDGTVTITLSFPVSGFTTQENLESELQKLWLSLKTFDEGFARKNHGIGWTDDRPFPALIPNGKEILHAINEDDVVALIRSWGIERAEADSESGSWIVPFRIGKRLVWISGGAGYPYADREDNAISLETLADYRKGPSSDNVSKEAESHEIQFSLPPNDFIEPRNNLWEPIKVGKGITGDEIKKRVYEFVKFANSISAN